jgi:hypothetical protein
LITFVLLIGRVVRTCSVSRLAGLDEEPGEVEVDLLESDDLGARRVLELAHEERDSVGGLAPVGVGWAERAVEEVEVHDSHVGRRRLGARGRGESEHRCGERREHEHDDRGSAHGSPLRPAG